MAIYFILGDQLNHRHPAWNNFSPAHDRVIMAEVAHESLKTWSTQTRTVYFLSTMRHFAQECREKGWAVDYYRLGEHQHQTFSDVIKDMCARYPVEDVYITTAGEYGVQQEVETIFSSLHRSFSWFDVSCFYTSVNDFKTWANGKKEVRMEWFYRTMRKKNNILMNGDEPMGGQWNYDEDNRVPPSKKTPPNAPKPLVFLPDKITKEVIQDVLTHIPGLPGECQDFDWPVNREQALLALNDFVLHRLPYFGPHQDMMVIGQTYLYHARLSAALNSGLLDPQEVVESALVAYQSGQVGLASVEGFIRQILGWREFVRGVYWLKMPDFLTLNALNAQQDLPDFYWTGNCQMACLKETIQSSLKTGYAHHIQRLMVTGLYAQLLGVRPLDIHHWYLAMYTDAVEWVELPNTLGMSQYADGGWMVSKPYVASGAYIQKMSNYCFGCHFDPKDAIGDRACPFTTLYWDFLYRHAGQFSHHPRTALQWKHIEKKSADFKQRVQDKSKEIRANKGIPLSLMS